MYTITFVLVYVIFAGLIQNISATNHTECPVGKVLCQDGDGCVPWRYVCDGDNDCTDRSDEAPCRRRDCNNYGTRHVTRTCKCKTGVTGPLCSQCRVGYYDFPRRSSKSQCLKCWCSGKSNECTSGGRQRSWIDSVKREQTKQVNDDINVVALDRSFLGNQLNSYGGSFEFKFSYQRKRTKPITGVPLLRIWGANKRHISYHYKGNYKAAKINIITIPLVESRAWHLDNMEAEATRADIMKILVNVSAMHLRTSLFIRQIISIRLASSRRVFAPHTVIKSEIAYEVESCKCPCHFSGESCEACSKGYVRNGTDCIEITAQIDVIDPVPTWNNFGSGFLAGAFGLASLVIVIALVAFAIQKLSIWRFNQMEIRIQNLSR